MADLLSAVSILLVFLILLFNGIEKEINEFLLKRKPTDAQTEAKKQWVKEINRLLIKAIAVTMIYTLIFYALLPKTIYIISTSSFVLWNFDELNTVFVFIELSLLGLTVFAITRTSQLLKTKYNN